MSFEKPAVVIDNGSYAIKAGFSCDNHPVSMFRTVVGRPNYLNGSYGREYYDVHIGDDAMERVEELELSKPVVNGRIVHWDNMERVWHHIFYRELKVAPEDRVVMLACSPTTPMDEKIKCCEVFFETLNSPGLCVQSQSILSLYGSGFTTGIGVDVGYDSTDINPGYEGGLISYAHMRTGLAGEQIARYITESLNKRGYDYGIRMPDIVEGIIEECCFVNTNPENEGNAKSDVTIELPNGETIDVTEEAFTAGEMLFKPELVPEHFNNKADMLPLHETVVTSSMKCDAELRPELYEAIVLCGGLAMLPGLSDRLTAEIETYIHRPVNVLTSAEAYSVSWLGGATFAGLPDAKKIWVMKEQYEEYGAKIIRNRFL